MSVMLSLGLLRTKFKPSLRSKDLQCFYPTKMGNEPPIPIIPERAKPSEEEEGEEKRKVKIEVSKGVTKTLSSSREEPLKTSSSSCVATKRSSRI